MKKQEIKPWFGLLHKKNTGYLSLLSPYDRRLTEFELVNFPMNIYEKTKSEQLAIQVAYLKFLNQMKGPVYQHGTPEHLDILIPVSNRADIYNNFIKTETCREFFFEKQKVILSTSDFCETIVYSEIPIDFVLDEILHFRVKNELVDWREEFEDYIEMNSCDG